MNNAISMWLIKEYLKQYVLQFRREINHDSHELERIV